MTRVLSLLQGKLALLSITTGGTAEMYTRTGVSGDFRYFLWPLQVAIAPHPTPSPQSFTTSKMRWD